MFAATAPSGMAASSTPASVQDSIYFLLSSSDILRSVPQNFPLFFFFDVNGFQCHSNNSLQLFELKEKTTTKQYTLFKRFLCDIL